MYDIVRNKLEKNIDSWRNTIIERGLFHKCFQSTSPDKNEQCRKKYKHYLMELIIDTIIPIITLKGSKGKYIHANTTAYF